MIKWEYKYLPIKHDLIEDFNKLGEDGWELILKLSDNYIFKRQKI